MKTQKIRNIDITDVLFLTTFEEFPCPYFGDGRISKVEACIFYDEFLEEAYSNLLPLGYRRINNLFYRNVCESCKECITLRVVVNEFKPSKSQRRLLKKNSQFEIVLSHSYVTFEKLLLYQNYITEVHNSHRNLNEVAGELERIHTGYPAIIEMDYYLDGKLKCVGVLDECKDALSSVYFYYDPLIRKRQPGIFSILKEIELAKNLEKKFLYLGYYISGLPKMSYKAGFKPAEILKDGKWIRL